MLHISSNCHKVLVYMMCSILDCSRNTKVNHHQRLPPIRHGRVCLEPAQAIKCRLARGRQEILVRWNNQDAAEASWIDLEEFRKKEHSLHSQFRGTSRVNCQLTSGSKLKGLFEMVKLIITIITGRGVFSMHYIRTYSN
jgi:hypothetical protein